MVAIGVAIKTQAGEVPQRSRIFHFGGGDIKTTTNGYSWVWRYRGTNTAIPQSSAFGNGTFVVVGADGVGGSYVLQSGNISGIPSIVEEPQDRGAVANNPATFSVQAVGAPPLAYQWYKDGTAIANATNTSPTTSPVCKRATAVATRW